MFHVKHPPPHILLLNPWITDFSAYNFWVKPIGLLYIASLLRYFGFRVTFIDCLDYYSKTKPYGDGKFFKTKIEKPPPLKSIPRNYCRYGISEEMLLKRLSMIEGKPDLIGITSGMTYWYPGVFQLIEIIKKFFKGVPVILGGLYVDLCYEHAEKYSGADFLFKNGSEWEAIKFISNILHFPLLDEIDNFDIDNLPFPAFDLYPNLKFTVILTSKGCPYHCSYCASPILSKNFIKRDPSKVVGEVEYWVIRYGIENIAFYDDALLINSNTHFLPIMNELLKRGIRCNFHVPNALHIREINEEVSKLLYQNNFKHLRLGFETSNEIAQLETGGKVRNEEFLMAIHHLKMAGFSGEEIGVYIMAGLPGQRIEEVEETVIFVRNQGARPILVEYSPIPKTPLFEKAKHFSPFDIENEPLFQNNSLFPCQWEGFTENDFKKLKERIKKGEI